MIEKIELRYQKINVLLFFMLLSISLVAQNSTINSMKKAIEKNYPITWSLYNRDSTITFVDYDFDSQTEKYLRLFYVIETGNNIMGMRYHLDSQIKLKEFFENLYSISCKKCETLEEVKDFNSPKENELLSQIKWSDDPNKGLVRTLIPKSEKDLELLIKYSKFKERLQKEFDLMQKELIKNWIIDNSERFRIIETFNGRINPGLTYDVKEMIKIGESYDFYIELLAKPDARVNFFNEAYSYIVEENVLTSGLRKFTLDLAKKYGITEGPSTDMKNEITDLELQDILSTGRQIEYERTNCEIPFHRVSTDEYTEFDPSNFLDVFWWDSDGGLLEDNRDNVFKKYRDRRIAGFKTTIDENKIISSENERSKNLHALGTKYENDWPKSIYTGFSKYLEFTPYTMAGEYAYGNYIERDNQNRVTLKISYRIKTQLIPETDYINVNDYLYKHNQYIPDRAGIDCGDVSRYHSYFGLNTDYYFSLNNMNYRVEPSQLRIFKYEYDSEDRITKMYWSDIDEDELTNYLTIGNLPDFANSLITFDVEMSFKDNMLNGKSIVRPGYYDYGEIAIALVPGLNINGEIYFYSFNRAPDYEITKNELMFENGLLNGTSYFYWRNTKTGEKGMIPVSFTNGLSEYDIKNINNLE